VEDNRDAAEMLDIAVSRLGHVTRLAHDGATAVALASEFVPDVIFLDIGLPVIDGYAVAQTVRDQPELRHAYIAAVTGWGQEEDRRKARDAGFDTHFTKPLSPAALEDVLDTVARRMTSDPDDGGTPRTRRTDSDPAL
jgi:CheY-like chemotaxis protein